ncbi:serine protease FAM111A-like [Puntigrus tetrazona]|uniref:serine protease FAM111A-like n=1 Tax=Puntigrus tetrazona TaxID=1606681 RepID=UPI001C88EB31|nr:serine protease FAM111A-like [Puntigrus tetrazona]
MSKKSPKKLKQAEISRFFSSVKKTATDSESGESSKDGENIQKTMDCSIKKEVEDRPSEDLQQEAEAETHTIKYCFIKSKTFSASCKTSMTVFEALNTSQMFRRQKDKINNEQKEILIQRFKEGSNKAAVKADFPCCLIESDEILEIDFIKKYHNSSTNGTTARLSSRNLEKLVSFLVKKEGGQKVLHLLKSKALRNRVQYVCVYAFKGEKIKKALRRDGRFNEIIFQKHCALSEFSDSHHELSNPVTEDLNRKEFQVVVVSDCQNQSDSQEDLTSVSTQPSDAVASDAVAETDGSSQNPISTEQQKKQDEVNTNPLTKRYAAKPITDSEEILRILREQFPVLLEQVKQREKLKKKSDVKEFFRVEYGKSVQSFSEVKKVKKLMRLSDSVCQIRKGGSAAGTGFLLFDRYILTNAHVIGLSIDVTKVNIAQFTAVFGYEDLDSINSIHIVQEVAAYFCGKDDKGMYLDYALLELDGIDKNATYPNLLECYRPNAPPTRGQICIVGHPGEGVKKMDPCFITEKKNQLEAAKKHASENEHLIHVMKEAWETQKWDFSAYENKMTYNSCFFHGSSGSPVFDVDCNLIGIHTGGYKYKTKGDKTYSVMEYGFSMQPILDDIRARAKIKGSTNIVRALEVCRNVPLTAEQQKQIDVEMESGEESDEH